MKAFQNLLNCAVLTVLVSAASRSNTFEMAVPSIEHAFEPLLEDHVPAGETPKPRHKTPADKKQRRKLLKLWIVFVIILLAVSAGVIFGCGLLARSYKLGVFISVIIWAVFFGICALYFLKQKVIA